MFGVHENVKLSGPQKKDRCVVRLGPAGRGRGQGSWGAAPQSLPALSAKSCKHLESFLSFLLNTLFPTSTACPSTEVKLVQVRLPHPSPRLTLPPPPKELIPCFPGGFPLPSLEQDVEKEHPLSMVPAESPPALGQKVPAEPPLRAVTAQGGAALGLWEAPA